jgi:hypothetical protein
MIVYSTWFSLDSSNDFHLILARIALWLQRKTRVDISVVDLKRKASVRLHTGFHLETHVTNGDYPNAVCVRLAHADGDVSGRQWQTEIGLRQESYNSDVEFTVLLSTSEISSRVTTTISPTRPFFVYDILTTCKSVAGTPGLECIEFDESSIDIAKYLIFDTQRKYPVTLISPLADGSYLVDPQALQRLVIGLSHILIIRPQADTFAISRVLGDRYSAWRGAVNIIYSKRGDSWDNSLVLPQRLSDIAAKETEVFSIITHKVNLPNSRRHISHYLIDEVNLRSELAKRRNELALSHDVVKHNEFLETFISSQENAINRLQADMEQYIEMYDTAENENRRLAYDLEAIKNQLEQASTRKHESEVNEETRIALLASLEGDKPTPIQCMLMIQTLFPAAIEFFDSAWRSAKESEDFRYGGKLLRLLISLASAYREQKVAGKGDNEAAQIFGEAYAARESEGVESNPKARKLRTFYRDGKEFEMMRHLKIGVKDSVSETIRVHFDWDSISGVILVGHVGPHLDFS